MGLTNNKTAYAVPPIVTLVADHFGFPMSPIMTTVNNSFWSNAMNRTIVIYKCSCHKPCIFHFQDVYLPNSNTTKFNLTPILYVAERICSSVIFLPKYFIHY